MPKQESINLEVAVHLDPPTASPTEVVEVLVSDDNLFGDFGVHFTHQMSVQNPLKWKELKLTADDVSKYIAFLVRKRVESVHHTLDKGEWEKLKLLWIPAWVQKNLRLIGRVDIRPEGLVLMPILEGTDTIDFAEAMRISNEIAAYADEMGIVQDAMPRSEMGDQDVMTTAMIAGYVRSIHRLTSPDSAYVTRFLGMKLREEATFRVMYRIQYNDLLYIQQALAADKGIYT